MGGTTTNYALRYPTSTDAPDGATQMQNLATDVDNAILSATQTQYVQPLFARKTVQEGRSSTTTLANDTSLKLTGLVSGAIYEVDMVLIYDGASGTGYIQWTFTVPSGSSGMYTVSRENISGNFVGAYPSNWTDTTNAHTTGVSTIMSLTFKGLLIAGANGTLQFQWSQQTSSATNTHVDVGSFLTARRVA